MYRVISIVLAMVGLAILFFGLSLCDDPAACQQASAQAAGGLAAQPVQVQRLMVLAGLLGFVGGAVGYLRGPTTLPPWGNRRQDVPADAAHTPLAVRGSAFLGAVFALGGILLPALVFSPKAGPALGFVYVVTLIVAILLTGYFTWYLAPRHAR